jgi:hypothetical protein
MCEMFHLSVRAITASSKYQHPRSISIEIGVLLPSRTAYDHLLDCPFVDPTDKKLSIHRQKTSMGNIGEQSSKTLNVVDLSMAYIRTGVGSLAQHEGALVRISACDEGRH